MVKERSNDKYIHLYKIDRYWFAFERSAFHLFSICYVDAVFKVRDLKEEDDAMLIAVLKNGLQEINHPQYTIIERSDNEMIIGCRTTFKGFQYWKDSLVSLFARNLYSTPDLIQIRNSKVLF